MKNPIVLVAAFLFMITACGQSKTNNAEEAKTKDSTSLNTKPAMSNKNDLDTATFGSGCYWCVEAIFQQLNGVDTVVSGFSGGSVKNPSYEAVCNGTTGHAEVIHLTYDPNVISYTELLEVFWKTHDPTTLNRQGYDVGTQYRSAIFYHTEEQKKLAEEYKKKLDEEGAFDSKIVTQIAAFDEFYPAKADHQNYYNNNKSQGYCRMVIVPKLEKFEKVFKDKMK